MIKVYDIQIETDYTYEGYIYTADLSAEERLLLMPGDAEIIDISGDYCVERDVSGFSVRIISVYAYIGPIGLELKRADKLSIAQEIETYGPTMAWEDDFKQAL